MNVFYFVLAVFALQPLIIVMGLGGYWMRPRYPRAGLVLGVVAIALALAGVLVTLWQYLVAAIAGAIIGAGAVIRPRSPVAAQWLVIGGVIVWVSAMALLLLDAGGL
jgi:hypothetical protein